MLVLNSNIMKKQDCWKCAKLPEGVVVKGHDHRETTNPSTDWEKEFERCWNDPEREGYFDRRTTKREIKGYIQRLLSQREEAARKNGAIDELSRLSAHIDMQIDFFQSNVSVASLRGYIEKAIQHLEAATNPTH